ncbi:hypothetical protein D3C87_1502020 [compost metagenome]
MIGCVDAQCDFIGFAERSVDVCCDAVQTETACIIADLAAKLVVRLFGDRIDHTAVAIKSTTEKRTRRPFDHLDFLHIRRVEVTAREAGKAVVKRRLRIETTQCEIGGPIPCPACRLPGTRDTRYIAKGVVVVGNALLLHDFR